MSIYLYIYLGILLVSLVSILGVVFLSFSPKILKKLTLSLVSLSAGTLLGGAFLHLLPESIEASGNSINVWISLLAGIIFFFILEKLIHWRHCHVPTCPEHPHHLGIMNLVGDAFHNFFDGLIIAGAFLVSIPLGIATLVAVVAHEIPQEIADFGVLVYAGYSKMKAILLNFLTALAAIIGATVAILFSNSIENFTSFIIPITAGGFIYIAIADLMPELNKEKSLFKSFIQLMVIALGIGIMLVLRILFE